MTMLSHHIIKKQYLHVELNGTESEGLALQRRLPDLCQHRLTPAIEQAIERFSPKEGYIFIERLEIDAGTFMLEGLEQKLAESVAQALEKLLCEQIPVAELSPTTFSGNIQLKTTQYAINEALIYFLKYGSLPWSFRLPADSTLEQVILSSFQEAAESGINPFSGSDEFMRALADAAVRKRLVLQFSPLFLETLISLLSPEGKRVMDGVLEALRSADISFDDRRHFEELLWEAMFASLATGNVPTMRELISKTLAVRKRLFMQFPHALLETLISLLLPEGKEVMDEVLEALRSADISSDDRRHFEELLWEAMFASLASGNALTSVDLVAKAWSALPVTATGHAALAKVLDLHWPDVTTRVSKSGGTKNGSERTQSQISELTKASVKGEHPETGDEICFEPMAENLPEPNKKSIMRSIHPDTGEGLYIENAGLVLLHPFLPRFFTGLGIADGDKLIKPERALCLLHFLTTGQLIAPEYELILPKILCNVPLEMPVESEVELTTAEQEEAAALLEAVIRHWEALRNTSPDSLRGTFLLRPGKVSLRGDDWLLQVESRGFDILLDQLPWGISMIKLPWMNKMLWVEWKERY